MCSQLLDGTLQEDHVEQVGETQIVINMDRGLIMGFREPNRLSGQVWFPEGKELPW